jgi:hypothetical protein
MPFKLAASSRRPAQHDTTAPVSHSMQHVRATVMIQCLFSPNGASPAAIAHGMPEKELGGNKCQNEWQPALSRGARAERLPDCCARLSCLVTGLLLLSFLSPHHRRASMAPSLLIFSVFPLFSLLLVFFNLLFTLLKLFLSPFVSHFGIFHRLCQRSRGQAVTPCAETEASFRFPSPFPFGLGSNQVFS